MKVSKITAIIIISCVINLCFWVSFLLNIQCSFLVSHDNGFVARLIRLTCFWYYIYLSHGSIAAHLYSISAIPLFKVDGTFSPYKLFRLFRLIHLLQLIGFLIEKPHGKYEKQTNQNGNDITLNVSIYMYQPKPIPKCVSPLKDTMLLMSASTSTSASMSPKKMERINCITKIPVVTTAIIRNMLLLIGIWVIVVYDIFRYIIPNIHICRTCAKKPFSI